MNQQPALEHAEERRLDWGLREALGDEEPPDVTARVLARVATGEEIDHEELELSCTATTGTSALSNPPEGRRDGPNSMRRGLLIAALLVLGFGVVLGVQALQEEPSHEPGEGSPAPASTPDAQDPRGTETPWTTTQWHVITSAAAIATLPPDTAAVALRELDDAALTALHDRCPQLRRLRLIPGDNHRFTAGAVVVVKRFAELREFDATGCAFLPTNIGDVLHQNCRHLRRVVLAGCVEIDDTTIADLIALRWLRELDLSDCPKLSRFGAELLVAARQLHRVKLHNATWLTPAIAEQLIRRGKIVASRFDAGTVADDARTAEEFNAGITKVQQRLARRLAKPRFEDVFTADEFALLPPTTTHLIVNGRFPLQPAQLDELCRRHQLRALHLLGVQNVRAETIARLATLPELRALRLQGIELADRASKTPLLQALARFENLEELHVSGIETLDGVSFATILTCRLRELALDGVGLSSDQIARISDLTALETLHLINAGEVDDAAVARFGNLTRLRELALWRTQLTADGLRPLAKLRELRSLMLNESPALRTEALLHLPVGLEELGLDSCPRLDATAGKLIGERFPGLRKLYLSSNPWVDNDVVSNVSALPRLETIELRDCVNYDAPSKPFDSGR
ncbi:MAG: hypothetical protein NXI31_19375 [bacterium]|nr:hypothetical protein [bacterium]